MSRMQLLEDAWSNIHTYTKTDSWRPGLVDLCVFNAIISMHESDEEDEQKEWIWSSSPDFIMERIIENDYFFDSLDYGGLEDLYEEVRMYLHEQKFIVHIDDEEQTTGGE